jgi:hypothetical protein
MALGDMDANGYTDIITVNMDQNSFKVHFYDSESKTYNATDSVFIDNIL